MFPVSVSEEHVDQSKASKHTKEESSPQKQDSFKMRIELAHDTGAIQRQVSQLMHVASTNRSPSAFSGRRAAACSLIWEGSESTHGPVHGPRMGPERKARTKMLCDAISIAIALATSIFLIDVNSTNSSSGYSTQCQTVL